MNKLVLSRKTRDILSKLFLVISFLVLITFLKMLQLTDSIEGIYTVLAVITTVVVLNYFLIAIAISKLDRIIKSEVKNAINPTTNATARR